MRIDARGSQELQDIVLAINRSDRDVQRVIRTYAKAELTRPWLEGIASRSNTTLERRVLAATATISVSNQNVRIQAAAKGRSLSGGLQPKVDYPGVEFGANRAKKKTYTRKGRRVTRRTAVQMPARRKAGPFYRTAEAMIPRLARLWVQSVVKGYSNIFEGKGF